MTPFQRSGSTQTGNPQNPSSGFLGFILRSITFEVLGFLFLIDKCLFLERGPRHVDSTGLALGKLFAQFPKGMLYF